MAAVAKAPAAHQAVKKEKKAPSTPEHPSYNVMVQAAITALNEKKGSSKQAILKYILENYSVGNNQNLVNAHLRKCLKTTAEKGILKQMTGTGASGSFKLAATTSKKAAKAPKEDQDEVKKSATPKKSPVVNKKPTPTKKAAPLKVTKKAATEPKMPKIKKTIVKKTGRKSAGAKTAKKAIKEAKSSTEASVTKSAPATPAKKNAKAKAPAKTKSAEASAVEGKRSKA